MGDEQRARRLGDPARDIPDDERRAGVRAVLDEATADDSTALASRLASNSLNHAPIRGWLRETDPEGIAFGARALAAAAALGDPPDLEGELLAVMPPPEALSRREGLELVATDAFWALEALATDERPALRARLWRDAHLGLAVALLADATGAVRTCPDPEVRRVLAALADGLVYAHWWRNSKHWARALDRARARLRGRSKTRRLQARVESAAAKARRELQHALRTFGCVAIARLMSEEAEREVTADVLREAARVFAGDGWLDGDDPHTVRRRRELADCRELGLLPSDLPRDGLRYLEDGEPLTPRRAAQDAMTRMVALIDLVAPEE